MHPNKHIRQALEEAIAAGWTFEKSSPRAHAYGILRCGFRGRGGCQMSIYGTPRSAEIHARKIRKRIDRCSH